jgi:USP8 dimerisation domain
MVRNPNHLKSKHGTGSDYRMVRILDPHCIRFSFQIRKSKEYKDDKKYYDAMISSKDLISALKKCETLSAALEDRYTVAKVAKENGSARKVTPPVKTVEVVKPAEKPTQPLANGIPKLGNYSGDPKSEHVRILDHGYLFGCQMVLI